MLTRRNFLRGIAATGAAAGLSPFISASRAFALEPGKETEILKSGPPEHRINLLVIGHGWETDGEAKFLEFVRKQLLEEGLKKSYDALKPLVPLLNIRALLSAGTPDPLELKTDNGRASGMNWAALEKFRKEHKADISCVLVNNPKLVCASKLDGIVGTTDLFVMFHEWGHGFGQGDEDLDDEWSDDHFSKVGTLNIDRLKTADAKPRWQEALDKKVKGVKTNPVAGAKDQFRGCEDACMMMSNGNKRGKQYGPLCGLGVYLNARKRVGLFESVTDDAAVIATAKGKKPDLAATVISSGAGQITAQGWSCAGAPGLLDALATKLREARTTRDEALDKGLQAKMEKETGLKLAKFEYAWDPKKSTYTAKTTLPAGSHVVVSLFTDPNPAIFMDPERITVSRKVHRVDVT
jgi:hypothetical protein